MPIEEGTSEVIARAIIQLDEYFARKRTIFDVPLLAVGTEFQRTVGRSCRTSLTENSVLRRAFTKAGQPKAVRAVAAANGQMPSPYSSPAIVWWAATIR